MSDNESNNKRIYICVTPFFPSPGNWRGAYVLDQVKAIQRHSDYEVMVFRTLPMGSKEYSYEVDGVTVHAIAPLLMPSYILNGASEGIVGRMFVRTLRKLGIDPMRVAFVHCHTTSHSAFGFGVKRVNPEAKVMVQFHDLDPLTLRNGKWADKRWNRRYRARKSISALNRADLLICISQPVKDVLLSFPRPRKAEVYDKALLMYKDIADMPAVKPNNVYVLNNGVDVSLFNENSSAPPPKPFPLTSKPLFRISCIANFQELKDHKSLVQAFKILIDKGYTDMRLSLLGSGETKADIEQFISENHLSDKVEWVKEMTHDQLPDYYRSLDLFVLPSYYEGFGCVYTEAYACGVPFICCQHQGAAECIPSADTAKWLVEPKNPQQLAERIERYYLARDKQTLCQPYDIDELIQDLVEYITKL